MDLLILIALIIAMIYFSKKSKDEEYIQKLEDDRQFKLSCVHHGNKNMIKKCGEENFIKYFGKEQYDKIKAGTDTEIAKMLPEYKKQRM